jgi:hypothetical protein
MKGILGLLIVAAALAPATTSAQMIAGDPFHTVGVIFTRVDFASTPAVDGERALLGPSAPSPVTSAVEPAFAACPVDGERALLSRCSTRP